MKPLYLIAASALALGAAACQPAPKTLTRLECPEHEGALTRISQSADGRACGYTGPNGEEISLRMAPVVGGPEATLARFEQELRSYIRVQPAVATATPAAEDGKPAAAVEKAASEPAPDAQGLSGAQAAARVSAEARSDAARGVISVDVDDGDHKGGDLVRVDIPGIHVEADESKDTAKVNILGGVNIEANDGGATIRQMREVRLKGEALSRERRGIRARLLIAGDQVGPDFGYLGYVAGGRKTGPLVVALVKSTSGDEPSGHSYRDLERLVRRNGGV